MRNNYFTWDMWGVAAFVAFCLSTIFMVFFSTMILEIGPKPWNKIVVLLACIIPLSLVLIWKIPKWKIENLYSRKELAFLPLIVLLGILNVVFSEDRATSFKMMTLFLLSGISVFFVTNVLFEKRIRRTIYLRVCWASLITLCIYGFYEYLNNRSVLVLSYNPILASALLLLLLVGPFVLIYENPKWLKPFLAISILLGMVVILLTGKRGAVLGLMGMGLALLVLVPRKKIWIFLIILSLVGTGIQLRNYFPKYLPDGYFKSGSFIERLENYPFAWPVFQKHPVL